MGRDDHSAKGYLRVAPHALLFPAGFLTATVPVFVMLGDAVREALDPKLPQRRPIRAAGGRGPARGVPDAGRAVRVVNGVSYHVSAGGTLGVLDESGAGKSATAHASMGILDPQPAFVTW